MSEELAQFLFQWLVWAGDTENSPYIFLEYRSLCESTSDSELEEELAAHLKNSGLDSLWAFDADGNAFRRDKQKHLNPLRIMWARQTLYMHRPDLAVKVFFRDWLKWAMTGAEHLSVHKRSVNLVDKSVENNYKPYAFCRDNGLCWNAITWLDFPEDTANRADYYLQDMEFGGKMFPFGSVKEFHLESDNGTCHLNPNRLAFCKEQVLKIYAPEWIK